MVHIAGTFHSDTHFGMTVSIDDYYHDSMTLRTLFFCMAKSLLSEKETDKLQKNYNWESLSLPSDKKLFTLVLDYENYDLRLHQTEESMLLPHELSEN